MYQNRAPYIVKYRGGGEHQECCQVCLRHGIFHQVIPSSHHKGMLEWNVPQGQVGVWCDRLRYEWALSRRCVGVEWALRCASLSGRCVGVVVRGCHVGVVWA